MTARTDTGSSSEQKERYAPIQPSPRAGHVTAHGVQVFTRFYVLSTYLNESLTLAR